MSLFSFCSQAGVAHGEIRRRRPAVAGASPRPFDRSPPDGAAKGARERRIVDLLNRGFSTAELAAAEGVTLRRMQILVKTILARHAPSAPADYLALQISRLNQAMFVACGEMLKGDLKAVDRVIRLVREIGIAITASFPTPTTNGFGRTGSRRRRRRRSLSPRRPTSDPRRRRRARWKWRRKCLRRLISAMGMAEPPPGPSDDTAGVGGDGTAKLRSALGDCPLHHASHGPPPPFR